MPRSALPEHLQDFDWSGTDNASWLMRQKKKVQVWLAGGPRVKRGFFKFRELPKTLLALRGGGFLRYENTDGSLVSRISQQGYYLSRIQPWVRWGVTLQWPFFFNCWFIYRAKDVVKYPKYQSAFGIGKMFTFGIGYKRDGDKVYWPTANLGGNFE